MNIRAKHGPHIVVFQITGPETIASVLVYARVTLNVTYGLKLGNEKGITLELL